MPPNQTPEAIKEEVDALIKQAEELKGKKSFGHARLLLAEARRRLKQHWHPTFGTRELKARQQHGLCTYKDVDLPPGDRFDEALRILDGTDSLAVPDTADRLLTTIDSETLGIAGAVHKAKWKYDAQRAHLERALHYYDRGYCQGRRGDPARIAADYGYTAINAAFILDLLAALEEDDLGRDDRSIAERRARAREIRGQILEILPGIADEKTGARWWYAATLAEADFGLGRFEEAAGRLKKAREANRVEDWEFESTARQLAFLLQLQPGDDQAMQPARRALSVGLDMTPEAAAILLVGKFGLALSGGGFRASLFHIGVLARLAELDVLRHVEVLSCVSGGSIIGAYYYLEVRELFKKKAPSEISRQDYLEIVGRIEQEFLAGVQTNIRTRMLGSLAGNLRMVWNNLSRSERIGELFEEMIFSRVKDDQERVLKELTIAPREWHAEERGPFQPKYHNWRLPAKVPILILNATTLNTGHNWQFTATFMGESPLSIDPDVDGNHRLRRLYYHEAPTEELRKFPLARAVGASACVPVFFEPIALGGLYPEKTVRLADGGVHDNQGIVGLLEQDCTVMLVSDASGQVGIEVDPNPSGLRVAVRTNHLLMARVREAQYRDLKARLRSRVIRGLMFLHLRKDLEVDPVDWVGCNNRSAAPMRDALTSYGILKEIQERLAAIRTDLDSFGEAEAFALMTSGYCMTDRVFAECIRELLATNEQREPWEFLKIRERLMGVRMGSEADRDLLRVLDVGKHQFFKFLHLKGLMKAARVALWVGLASTLIVMSYVLWAYPSYPRLNAWTIASWAIPVLIGLIGLGWVTKYLFPTQRPFNFARNLGMAVVGWPVSLVILSVFDPWYLRRGRDYRKMPVPVAPPPTGASPTASARD